MAFSSVPVSSNGRPLTMAQALELLQNGPAEKRRQATERIGQLGDMRDERCIPPLVEALRDEDPVVYRLAERVLWEIWHRSGSPQTDSLLQEGINLMGRGEHAQAAGKFTQVIDSDPGFAEGYNKRATVYYLMGEYEKSIADCERTIQLNPVHFGALSGEGLCYLNMNRPDKALEYFVRAVTVNPNLQQIKLYIRKLKQR